MFFNKLSGTSFSCNYPKSHSIVILGILLCYYLTWFERKLVRHCTVKQWAGSTVNLPQPGLTSACDSEQSNESESLRSPHKAALCIHRSPAKTDQTARVCVCSLKSSLGAHVILLDLQHPGSDYISLRTTKSTKWPVRPAKTQINLGIRPVWSESSLCAWRNLGP